MERSHYTSRIGGYPQQNEDRYYQVVSERTSERFDRDDLIKRRRIYERLAERDDSVSRKDDGLGDSNGSWYKEQEIDEHRWDDNVSRKDDGLGDSNGSWYRQDRVQERYEHRREEGHTRNEERARDMETRIGERLRDMETRIEERRRKRNTSNTIREIRDHGETGNNVLLNHRGTEYRNRDEIHSEEAPRIRHRHVREDKDLRSFKDDHVNRPPRREYSDMPKESWSRQSKMYGHDRSLHKEGNRFVEQAPYTRDIRDHRSHRNQYDDNKSEIVDKTRNDTFMERDCYKKDVSVNASRLVYESGNSRTLFSREKNSRTRSPTKGVPYGKDDLGNERESEGGQTNVSVTSNMLQGFLKRFIKTPAQSCVDMKEKEPPSLPEKQSQKIVIGRIAVKRRPENTARPLLDSKRGRSDNPTVVTSTPLAPSFNYQTEALVPSQSFMPENSQKPWSEPMNNQTTPHGQYNQATPHGQYSQALSHGQYSQDIPHGQYNQTIPLGQYSKALPPGQYGHAMPHGQYSQTMSHVQNSQAMPPGQYSLEKPLEPVNQVNYPPSLLSLNLVKPRSLIESERYKSGQNDTTVVDDALKQQVHFVSGMKCPGCPLKERRFPSLESFSKHWDLKHRRYQIYYPCPVTDCTATTETKAGLLKHIRNKHEMAQTLGERVKPRKSLPNTKTFVDPGCYVFGDCDEPMGETLNEDSSSFVQEKEHIVFKSGMECPACPLKQKKYPFLDHFATHWVYKHEKYHILYFCPVEGCSSAGAGARHNLLKHVRLKHPTHNHDKVCQTLQPTKTLSHVYVSPGKYLFDSTGKLHEKLSGPIVFVSGMRCRVCMSDVLYEDELEFREHWIYTHEPVYRVFPCPDDDCDYTTVTKDGLREHYTECHSFLTESVNSQIDSLEPPETTNPSFVSPGDSSYRIESSHGDDNEGPIVIEFKENMTCPICKKKTIFKKGFDFRNHWLLTHTRSHERIPCPQKDCKNNYGNSTSLKHHYQFCHNKKKPLLPETVEMLEKVNPEEVFHLCFIDPGRFTFDMTNDDFKFQKFSNDKKKGDSTVAMSDSVKKIDSKAPESDYPFSIRFKPQMTCPACPFSEAPNVFLTQTAFYSHWFCSHTESHQKYQCPQEGCVGGGTTMLKLMMHYQRFHNNRKELDFDTREMLENIPVVTVKHVFVDPGKYTFNPESEEEISDPNREREIVETDAIQIKTEPMDTQEGNSQEESNARFDPKDMDISEGAQGRNEERKCEVIKFKHGMTCPACPVGKKKFKKKTVFHDHWFHVHTKYHERRPCPHASCLKRFGSIESLILHYKYHKTVLDQETIEMLENTSTLTVNHPNYHDPGLFTYDMGSDDLTEENKSPLACETPQVHEHVKNSDGSIVIKFTPGMNCPACPTNVYESFGRLFLFKNHWTSVHTMYNKVRRCLYCNKIWSSLQSLMNHYQNHHNKREDLDDKTRMMLTQIPVETKSNHETFINPGNYTFPIEPSADTNQDEPAIGSSMAPISIVFKAGMSCPACCGVPRRFKDERGFSSHWLESHTPFHERFTCPVNGCDKGGASLSSLVTHYSILHNNREELDAETLEMLRRQPVETVLHAKFRDPGQFTFDLTCKEFKNQRNDSEELRSASPEGTLCTENMEDDEFGDSKLDQMVLEQPPLLG